MTEFISDLLLSSSSSTAYVVGSFFSKLVNKDHPAASGIGCTHPLIHQGICLRCKEPAGDESSKIRLDCVEPGLRISCAEFGKLRDEISRNLLSERKLQLILDLDHTLLHTVSCSKLTADEMNESLAAGSDMFKSTLQDKQVLMSKLRPLVRSFLAEASIMFELSIYTKGTRSYAKRMVELIDPERCYFGNRVLSRDDSTSEESKSLNALLAKESCTLILDDSASAWPEHSANLILAEPYNYFTRSTHDYRKICPRKKGRIEDNDYLTDVLNVLKNIYNSYFDKYFKVNRKEPVDVREVLSELRRDVLKDCIILLIPRTTDKTMERAKQLGATILWDKSSTATHVISDSENWNPYARWGRENNKFVVSPEWISAAYRLWRKPSEHDFLSKDDF